MRQFITDFVNANNLSGIQLANPYKPGGSALGAARGKSHPYAKKTLFAEKGYDLNAGDCQILNADTSKVVDIENYYNAMTAIALHERFHTFLAGGDTDHNNGKIDNDIMHPTQPGPAMADTTKIIGPLNSIVGTDNQLEKGWLANTIIQDTMMIKNNETIYTIDLSEYNIHPDSVMVTSQGPIEWDRTQANNKITLSAPATLTDSIGSLVITGVDQTGKLVIVGQPYKVVESTHTVDIEDMTEAIRPVPAHDVLNIQMKEGKILEHVVITDMKGNVVCTLWDIGEAETQIALKNIAPGVYTLSISGRNYISSKSIVIVSGQ